MRHRLRLVGSAISFVWLAACAASPASKAAQPEPVPSTQPAPPPPPLPPAAPAEPAPKGPQESPGFADTLAALRPTGTEAALTALNAAPTSAEPYAQAALAYAPTNAPGMSLLWGMSYQAMGGGKSDAALATALSKVLTERILASPAENGTDVNFNLRLAPGQMPARQNADGSIEAPLAHVFEGSFGPAVVGFRPPWTIEQFYDAISTWAGIVSAHGTPLDEKLELDAWLVATAKAGQLEAFCHQLLGPAFAAEYKAYKAGHAAELKSYQAYLKASAFRPTRALMPDDMVRLK